jgi:hypothetical protein
LECRRRAREPRAAGASASVAKRASARTRSECERRSSGGRQTCCPRGCSFVAMEVSVLAEVFQWSGEVLSLDGAFRSKAEVSHCWVAGMCLDDAGKQPRRGHRRQPLTFLAKRLRDQRSRRSARADLFVLAGRWDRRRDLPVARSAEGLEDGVDQLFGVACWYRSGDLNRVHVERTGEQVGDEVKVGTRADFSAGHGAR